MLLDISSALNLSFVHMPVCWKFIMIEIIYHTWDLSWLTKILLLQKSPWTIVSNFEDESFWFFGEALFQRALKSDFLNLCTALIISSGFPMIIICFSSDLKVLNQSFASRSFICKLHKPKIHEIKSVFLFFSSEFFKSFRISSLYKVQKFLPPPSSSTNFLDFSTLLVHFV